MSQSHDPYAPPPDVDQPPGLSAGDILTTGFFAFFAGVLVFVLVCGGLSALSESLSDDQLSWSLILCISAVVATAVGLSAWARSVRHRTHLHNQISSIEHELKVELAQLKHEAARKRDVDNEGP